MIKSPQELQNSKGQIFYGMHFYPGVARYDSPDKESLTVFINEDTIRKMSPSFAGRPIFVEHMEDVNEDVNELRKEADGWVIESFFNQADGKTWAKFIIVSDRGFAAIKRGYRLSNAYIPQLSIKDGVWNGVPYQQEVVGGEYEHLAIVNNPRYDESVIMTPEEFKSYNEARSIELKTLSNSKNNKGESKMKFFKRTKVENSVDLESTMVELPKSKKEISISNMIEEYDKIMNMHGYANEDHMVKVGENEMSVKDLVKDHMKNKEELEGMKLAKNADGGEPGKQDEDPAMENDDLPGGLDNDDEEKIVEAGKKDVSDRGGDKSLDNEEEDEEEKKKKDKKENDILSAAREIIRAKAKKLKNAGPHLKIENAPTIELGQDKVARGKALYGSGN